MLGCAALTHSAPEERAIVQFKDGSAQLYKNDPIVFAHDLSDEQDFKIMLSWWLTYVEAQKAGVEADDTEINRYVEQEKILYATDPETKEHHTYRMDRYGLSEDDYWKHVRANNTLSSVVNQYLDNTNVNIDQLQGPELKIAVAVIIHK
ncbi:hypothetical protein PAE9249_03519 [Paenibacillus sp. CECT 9249]|nr:hypothetical protein PAE9249_03519 [Paenibacillus sp. CECT 9249]